MTPSEAALGVCSLCENKTNCAYCDNAWAEETEPGGRGGGGCRRNNYHAPFPSHPHPYPRRRTPAARIGKGGAGREREFIDPAAWTSSLGELSPLQSRIQGPNWAQWENEGVAVEWRVTARWICARRVTCVMAWELGGSNVGVVGIEQLGASILCQLPRSKGGNRGLRCDYAPPLHRVNTPPLSLSGRAWEWAGTRSHPPTQPPLH